MTQNSADAQKEDCKDDESEQECKPVEPEVKECDCKKYTLIFNFN